MFIELRGEKDERVWWSNMILTNDQRQEYRKFWNKTIRYLFDKTMSTPIAYRNDIDNLYYRLLKKVNSISNDR